MFPRKLEHEFRMTSSILYLKGMRILMFQLSVFYCKGFGFTVRASGAVTKGLIGLRKDSRRVVWESIRSQAFHTWCMRVLGFFKSSGSNPRYWHKASRRRGRLDLAWDELEVKRWVEGIGSNI